MEWDAVINAILSFIIPGLGQIINDDKKKGIIMFLISLSIICIGYYFRFVLIANAINFIFALYCAYDAYVTY